MSSQPKEAKAEEKEEESTHVVVALDKSRYSEYVLDWCASHINKIADRITFVHAYEYSSVPIMPGPGFAATGLNIVELNKEVRENAIKAGTDFLQNAARRAKKIGFAPHELKLVEGGPGRTPKQAILDFTEKYKPDMLICGSRGMGAVSRMFLGSVSDYLLHQCKCTVVVVKTPEDLPEKKDNAAPKKDNVDPKAPGSS
ncbi:hypothetical protein AAMO2058_000672000 [Amorphochlora amoebiformis]